MFGLFSVSGGFMKSRVICNALVSRMVRKHLPLITKERCLLKPVSFSRLRITQLHITHHSARITRFKARITHRAYCGCGRRLLPDFLLTLR
jgi:hypothetical protein